jgi:phage terminase large subunit GpA-like protein
MQELDAHQLKSLIAELNQRVAEIKSSRSIDQVVKENFSKRMEVIEQQKRKDFEESLKRIKSVVQLEISIVESIKEFLDEEVVDFVSLTLEKARHTNNLKTMMSAYSKYRGNIKIRQVLKLITAVYRYNRNIIDDVQKTPSFYISISTLKSQIKYSTICPHCGETSKKILVNMLQTQAVQLP